MSTTRYAIHVCEQCGTQCDPDGHWGCPAKGYVTDLEHGPLIEVPVPDGIVTSTLAIKRAYAALEKYAPHVMADLERAR